MKLIKTALAIIMLFPTAHLTFAQHSGHGGMGSSGSMGSMGPMGPTYSTAQQFAMMANDNQIAAFEKCMEATQQVRISLAQMDQSTNRSRGGEAQQANDVSPRKQQLEALLKYLAETHDAFGLTLTEAQRKGLERQLRKLNELQTEMSTVALRVAQTAMDSSSGPGSRRIGSDLKTLRKDAERWHSEHRKIAKQMSIPS